MNVYVDTTADQLEVGDLLVVRPTVNRAVSRIERVDPVTDGRGRAKIQVKFGDRIKHYRPGDAVLIRAREEEP